MSKEEYNALEPASYFYVLLEQNGGMPRKTGTLKKYSKSERFYKSEGLKKTPFYVEYKGFFFKKHKIYLEIDGKRTLLTDGTKIELARVRIKRRKLEIFGDIPYEKTATLFIGEKEIHLDDRIYNSQDENFFKMLVFRGDEFMSSTFLETRKDDLKGVFISADKSNIILKNKTLTPLLYVIDGVEIKDENPMKEIAPDSVKMVKVLKGEAATAIYGERGKNGVIVITTKKK